MTKRKDPHSDGLDETPGDEIDEKESKKILVLDNYKCKQLLHLKNDFSHHLSSNHRYL